MKIISSTTSSKNLKVAFNLAFNLVIRSYSNNGNNYLVTRFNDMSPTNQKKNV